MNDISVYGYTVVYNTTTLGTVSGYFTLTITGANNPKYNQNDSIVLY
jgi:hypothetical protein